MIDNEWDSIYYPLCRLKNIPPNEQTKKIYFGRLHTYSVTQVKKAIGNCVDQLTWMPQPNEILAELQDITKAKPKNADDWMNDVGLPVGSSCSIWDKGGDVSDMSDNEILDALMSQFGPEWLGYLQLRGPDKRLKMINGYPSQAWNMLKECRKGLKMFCDEVKESSPLMANQ